MNWNPFLVADRDSKPISPRSLESFEGIGDRLRSAAFAELQAREAFLWAASHFIDAPEALRKAWQGLAQAEQKHLDWLLNRMEELKIGIQDRPVSDHLWVSLVSCKTASEFAIYMASAEERGRKAGLRFYESLEKRDPITAEIFRKIAIEEEAHIALAQKFFPT